MLCADSALFALTGHEAGAGPIAAGPEPAADKPPVVTSTPGTKASNLIFIVHHRRFGRGETSFISVKYLGCPYIRMPEITQYFAIKKWGKCFFFPDAETKVPMVLHENQ